MSFSKAAAQEKYGDIVRFDRDGYEAMSRVNAREAAFDTAAKGLRLVIGAGNGNAANLSAQTGLVRIEELQRGIIEDMDLISAKLNETFRAK